MKLQLLQELFGIPTWRPVRSLFGTPTWRTYRVLMGVPYSQLTTNFIANYHLTTVFLAKYQLTANPNGTLYVMSC